MKADELTARELVALLLWKQSLGPVYITADDVDSFVRAQVSLVIDVPYDGLTLRLVTNAEAQRIAALG